MTPQETTDDPDPSNRPTHAARWQVEHGDCLDVLAQLPDASVGAIVCDPAYGIDFPQAAWDG